ncbi:hypothetical protein [Streptomyces sp. NPDC057939]|uniref:hypothetical protein n=1 Tax=Streptomyces sp. NPDC057939 TaxID=3346284 RepID=UPI0036EBBC28
MLTGAGSGRTRTEWVPDKFHSGVFRLDGIGATTCTLTGKGSDVLCKGDTGGPLLNAAGGFGEFTAGYAVPVSSWDRGSMKLVSVDFNGARRAHVGMTYRFGDGSIKMCTGLADAAGHIQPFSSSAVVPASAGWNWNAIQLP